jgi:hypothetical protein
MVEGAAAGTIGAAFRPGFSSFDQEAFERLLAPVRACPADGFVEVFRACRARSHSVMRLLDEPGYYIAKDIDSQRRARAAVTAWLLADDVRKRACDLAEVPPPGTGLDGGVLRLRVPYFCHGNVHATGAGAAGADACGRDNDTVWSRRSPTAVQLERAVTTAIADAWYEELTGGKRDSALSKARAHNGGDAAGAQRRGKISMRPVEDVMRDKAAKAAVRQTCINFQRMRGGGHDAAHEDHAPAPPILACASSDWLPDLSVHVFEDARTRPGAASGVVTDAACAREGQSACSADTTAETEAEELAVVADVGTECDGGLVVGNVPEAPVTACNNNMARVGVSQRTREQRRRVALLAMENLHVTFVRNDWMHPIANWRQLQDLPWLHYACRPWRLAVERRGRAVKVYDGSDCVCSLSFDDLHCVWCGWTGTKTQS